jgi:hypothetical protein
LRLHVTNQLSIVNYTGLFSWSGLSLSCIVLREDQVKCTGKY